MKISPIHLAKSFAANFNDKKYDRVKKIALEVLKVFGAILLGALAGGLTLASSGTIWIVVGATLGAVTAIGSYGLGKGFVHLQKKHGFPAHAFRKAEPFDQNSYLTKKKEKKFDQIIEKTIMPLPEYAKWKKLRGIKNDQQAKRLFRKAVRGSCSLGQAHGLAAAIAKMNKPIDPLSYGKLDTRFLFSKQILQILANDLGARGEPLEKKIKKIPPHFFRKVEPIDTKNYFTNKRVHRFEAIIKQQIKPLPEYAEWKKLRGNVSDRQARHIFREAILKQCALGQAHASNARGAKKNEPTTQLPFGKFDAEALFTHQIFQVMADDLGDEAKALHDKILQIPETIREKTLKYSQDAFPRREELIKDLRKPLIGTATFVNGSQRHTIFFEVTEKGGRFYDGSHRLAGFHQDFNSQEEFLNVFYKHIRLGILGHNILRKQYKAVEIELFQIQ